MIVDQANKNKIILRAEIDDENNLELIKNLFGDRQRYIQIFMNFLSNAMKFTDNGGTITVKIKVVDHQPVNTEDNPEMYVNLQICIIDTGIGMTEEGLKKMFTNFGKLQDSSNRNTTGTGLGLSICKKIIEKMGGSVEVFSQLGVGTEFQIRIKAICKGVNFLELQPFKPKMGR